MTIGERLKRIRKDKGMTASELAAKVGVSSELAAKVGVSSELAAKVGVSWDHIRSLSPTEKKEGIIYPYKGRS